MKTPAIIGAVTFSIFMAEAIIHYNIGAEAQDKAHKFAMPPMNELIKIGAIVLVASLISSSISAALIKK